MSKRGMPKRVLGNIVNFNNAQNHIGGKRVADISPKPLSKKSRTQAFESVKCELRNCGKENIKKEADLTTKKQVCEPVKSELRSSGKENVKIEVDSSTRTLELRVRNINIGSENKQNISVKQEICKDEPKKEIGKCCAREIDFSDPKTYYEKPEDIPSYIDDFDKSQLGDIFSEPHYAQDIFNFYKSKELELKCKFYLHEQTEISKSMRAVLVDWLVEVQETFELNHETLYLAVKIIDHYLMKENVPKVKFQLLGATAMLIAAKYDERIPPSIEDFLYICDNAYTRQDVILQEIDILKKLDFCLGYPLSYRFLRRYARCSKLSMETLTLARYILETSLLEYELIESRDSMLAAASLLLALRMKNPNQDFWTQTLEYYSGYEEKELIPIVYRLNEMISSQKNQKTIRNKYSHKIFFEVAKIPPLSKRRVSFLFPDINLSPVSLCKV